MQMIQLTVGMMAVCCYIVWCPETMEGAIIDPGGSEEEILDRCKREQLVVKHIICTHGHPDHVCGNGVIKKATGASIIMHADDAAFFAKPEISSYFSMLGLPESPPPDRMVYDGDEIVFGKESLKVIHTPGHTPGGICLYNKPNLFCGDTLFAGGVGRTDFPGGSTAQLLDSIRKKLLVMPEETVVWPGHGYGGTRSSIGEEKRTNSFLSGGW